MFDLAGFLFLHMKNLLLITILNGIVAAATYFVVRSLRGGEGEVGPVAFWTLKLTRVFSIPAIALFFLMMYFVSQLMYQFYPEPVDIYGEPLIIYLSAILAIVIGIKMENRVHNRKRQHRERT